MYLSFAHSLTLNIMRYNCFLSGNLIGLLCFKFSVFYKSFRSLICLKLFQAYNYIVILADMYEPKIVEFFTPLKLILGIMNLL